VGGRGGGKRLLNHIRMNMALKHLVRTCYTPAGCVIPRNVLIEPPRLRSTRQDHTGGHLRYIGSTTQRNVTVMDLVIALALANTCLQLYKKSSDFTICKVENVKFDNDARSSGPIHYSATRRLVPQALNNF
jgi:hypothetical protein